MIMILNTTLKPLYYLLDDHIKLPWYKMRSRLAEMFYSEGRVCGDGVGDNRSGASDSIRMQAKL